MKIYPLKQQLQRQKVKLVYSEYQLIFLERCITNKIIPKFNLRLYCQVKSPILSKKMKMLQKEAAKTSAKLSKAKNVQK